MDLLLIARSELKNHLLKSWSVAADAAQASHGSSPNANEKERPEHVD